MTTPTKHKSKEPGKEFGSLGPPPLLNIPTDPWEVEFIPRSGTQRIQQVTSPLTQEESPNNKKIESGQNDQSGTAIITEFQLSVNTPQQSVNETVNAPKTVNTGQSVNEKTVKNDPESVKKSESVNNRLTNGYETVKKPELPPSEITEEFSQSVNNRLTNGYETVKNDPNVDKSVNNRLTNGYETVKKSGKIIDYKSCSKSEIKILSFLFDECVKNSTFHTQKLRLKEVSAIIGVPYPSLRVLIHTLRHKKKMITANTDAYDGPGGSAVYSLNSDVYGQIRDQKILEQNIESVNNRLTKSSMYVCSLNTDIQGTQGTKTVLDQLPEDWQKIDLSEIRRFKFTSGDLVECYTQDLSADQVQQSIDEFVFDKVTNKKDYSKRALIKVLKAGKVWMVKNYQDPAEKKIQEMSQIFKERQERIAKLSEEALNGVFEEYYRKLDKTDLAKRYPGSSDFMLKQCARTEFNEISKGKSVSQLFAEIVQPEIDKEATTGAG